MTSKTTPSIQITRFDDAETFTPHGHSGVVNRSIAGTASHQTPELSVWWGEFDRAGQSELHIHENALQLYVVLSGSFDVGDGVHVHSLTPGDSALIRAGVAHQIEATSENAGVLVITTPGLR